MSAAHQSVCHAVVPLPNFANSALPLSASEEVAPVQPNGCHAAKACILQVHGLVFYQITQVG